MKNDKTRGILQKLKDAVEGQPLPSFEQRYISQLEHNVKHYEKRAEKAEAEAKDIQESHLRLYGDMKEFKRKLKDAEAENARLRAALFCENCGGTGYVTKQGIGFSPDFRKVCPTCGPIREALKEAE